MTSGVFLKHASSRSRQELLSTTGTGERLSRAERKPRAERRNAIAPARQTSPARPAPIPRPPKLPELGSKLGLGSHSKRLASRQLSIAILLGIVAGAVAARAAGFI